MKTVTPPSTRPAPKPKAPQSHEVRIIGGQWKRSKLQVADKPGLRPTPDRVRETLFNWLGQDLSGWLCLDVFAGTGALGFEAASRGAAQVELVERDPALVMQLKRIQDKLNAQAVRVTRGDGLAVLKQQSPGSLGLIFLDPPFDADVFEAIVSAASRAISPVGFVYLEAPKIWVDDTLQPMGLQVYRHLKAGKVHAHLLKSCSRESVQVDNLR
jgi:16S rRNA (guanine(966)-N(2))-methyltransferase RsmD